MKLVSVSLLTFLFKATAAADASPSTMPTVSAGPSTSPSTSTSPSNSPSNSPASIDLGTCENFAVIAASTATCAGAPVCTIIGGKLGVSPGTAITGNFIYKYFLCKIKPCKPIMGNWVGQIVPVGTTDSSNESNACAADGRLALAEGTALPSETSITWDDLEPAQIGGSITFYPGVYTAGISINIALTSPNITLDARGDPDAQFVFKVATTLVTCAKSHMLLVNGAKKENIYWVIGTALTMGADSVLVGNVLVGSAVTIGTNGWISGRVIAQTAVTCETHCTIDATGTPEPPKPIPMTCCESVEQRRRLRAINGFE